MTEFRTRIIQPTVLFALLSFMVVSCARAQEPGPAAASTPESEASEPPPELQYVDATLMFTDCETVSNFESTCGPVNHAAVGRGVQRSARRHSTVHGYVVARRTHRIDGSRWRIGHGSHVRAASRTQAQGCHF